MASKRQGALRNGISVKVYTVNSIRPIIIGFFAILGIHIVATLNYWYWKIWWFDMPMHFFGGIFAAMVFFYFIIPKIEIETNKKIILFFLTLSFTSLIGVSWEFFEFFQDLIIFSKSLSLYSQISSADTLKDLAFALLGSSAFFLNYFKKLG